MNVLINYPEYTIVARLGFVDTLSFFNSFSNHHSERIIDREKQCSSFSKAYVCCAHLRTLKLYRKTLVCMLLNELYGIRVVNTVIF